MCRKYAFLLTLVVDCWDGPQGEPVVYHGRTFTSKILLRDVLEVIQKYSFVVSEYPVVLSFEIHCSPEQQQAISSMLRQIFKSSLYLNPETGGAATCFPSLNSMLGKTLVKAKIFLEEDEDEYSSPNSTFDGVKELVLSPLSSPVGKSSDEGYFKRRKPSIVQELFSLLTLKTRTFPGFEVSRESFQFDQMSSIGERRSINFALKQRMQYVEHNSRFITRVYPASLRINSSNFDPIAHWKSGCQVFHWVYTTIDGCFKLSDV
jgi:hypothetical protein